MNNLYLSGFMVAGKSTVGSILAQRMGWQFIDLDYEITLRTGMSIVSFFKEKGEMAFRALEAEVLKEVSVHSKRIIALGGGTLLREENRKRVEFSGIHIYLRAQVHTLAERILLAPRTRPLLENIADEPLPVRIRILMRHRKQFYENADVILDTDGKSHHQTIQDLLDIFPRFGILSEVIQSVAV